MSVLRDFGRHTDAMEAGFTVVGPHFDAHSLCSDAVESLPTTTKALRDAIEIQRSGLGAPGTIRRLGQDSRGPVNVFSIPVSLYTHRGTRSAGPGAPRHVRIPQSRAQGGQNAVRGVDIVEA